MRTLSRDSIDLPGEIWKPVAGRENAYHVSSMGRVKSIDHFVTSAAGIRRFFPGYILRLANDLPPHRYHTVSISGKTRQVHWLVAEAFIGPRPEGVHINHINGVKADNRSSNLEYVTPRENALHAHRTGLMSPVGQFKVGRRPESARLTPNLVRYIRREVQRKTHGQLARELGFSRPAISAVVNRKTWRDIE